MGKLATVIEAPIEGALGTMINPGDIVMVVTTGYSHNVSVKKGKYIGYIESTGYYYKKRARIEVEGTRSFQMKPDGTEFSWSKDYNNATWDQVKQTLVRKTVPHTYKTTLNLNRIATIQESDYAIVDTVGQLV
jgi:hypothetical protein